MKIQEKPEEEATPNHSIGQFRPNYKMNMNATLKASAGQRV